MSEIDPILDALCSVDIPFATNEAARRGFIMAINEDGTLNPEKAIGKMWSPSGGAMAEVRE